MPASSRTKRNRHSMAASATWSGTLHQGQDHIDVQASKPLPPRLPDDEYYNATVLRLTPPMNEDDLDDRIALEAQGLGLLPVQPTSDIDGVTSSLSTVTFGSDSTKQGSSIQSQSTAPTSCDSSDYRPVTQSSRVPEQEISRPETSAALHDNEKKPRSPFRRGFRKMAGFRKRRSAVLSTPTLSSINSAAGSNTSGELSIKSDLKRPLSLKSSKSSWSQPISATKSTYEDQPWIDPEALNRSMGSAEMLHLRKTQYDEKYRFLKFQNASITDLRSQYDYTRAQRRTEQDRIIAEQVDKVSLAPQLETLLTCIRKRVLWRTSNLVNSRKSLKWRKSLILISEL